MDNIIEYLKVNIEDKIYKIKNGWYLTSNTHIGLDLKLLSKLNIDLHNTLLKKYNDVVDHNDD